MDKVLTKRQLEAVGIPVVPYETIDGVAFEADPAAFLARVERFEPPLFVKPRAGGSSVGVRKVRGARRGRGSGALRPPVRRRGAGGARRHRSGAGGGGARPRARSGLLAGPSALRRSARSCPGKDFYDYEDKYLTDGAQLIAPAELPEEVDASGCGSRRSGPSRRSAATAWRGSTSCSTGPAERPESSSSTRSTPSPASPASPCTRGSGGSRACRWPSWSTAWSTSPSRGTGSATARPGHPRVDRGARAPRGLLGPHLAVTTTASQPRSSRSRRRASAFFRFLNVPIWTRCQGPSVRTRASG